MDINLYRDDASLGNVIVDDSCFGVTYNEPLVHQVVVAYFAWNRSGSKAQKNRSQVRGGGAKPWRQKGTGRARAGSVCSPIFRGGGVTFAAYPRNYSQKVNSKMYAGAMRSILSELIRRGRLMVLETIDVEKPKTKLIVKKMNDLNVSHALIVVEEYVHNLMLAARNIHWLFVCLRSQLNPVDLLRFDKILISVDALHKLDERLKCIKKD